MCACFEVGVVADVGAFACAGFDDDVVSKFDEGGDGAGGGGDAGFAGGGFLRYADQHG